MRRDIGIMSLWTLVRWGESTQSPGEVLMNTAFRVRRCVESALAMTSLAVLPRVGLPQPPDRSSDSVAVSTVIEGFRRALSEGDSAAVLALLADDAIVLENGNVESRDEYRSHHLAADIAFSRVVPAVRNSVALRIAGDVAWAASTSTSQGEFRGRAVNSMGAELLLLTRTTAGWRISAIHWSSRQRRQ